MGAGVTRVGSVGIGTVRVGIPSPAGTWNPQLDSQHVDFDRDQFTAFIADKGYSVTWEKAMLCPNLPGGGLAPRDHNMSCTICDGRGFVYVDPINTSMLMEGIRINQSFYAYGRWDTGNMLVTAEPEMTMEFMDRLTLQNGVARFTQRVIRQLGTMTDVLRYAPLAFRWVGWVDRTGALVTFSGDTDYQVSSDGTSIQWYGNQPDAGSWYTVGYDYRPRYVVLDLVHQHRDSTVEGQHYQFPMQAVAKLDYLVRNEGKDPQQVVDRNPFAMDGP